MDLSYKLELNQPKTVGGIYNIKTVFTIYIEIN
jgi:hypothetical protein